MCFQSDINCIIFKPDKRECCDIDQCFDSPCPSNSDCINDCVGYTCKCHEGFTAVGDECIEGATYTNQYAPPQPQEKWQI